MRIATLGEMLDDLVRRGEESGTEDQARELRGELEGRLAAIGAAFTGATHPRVVALEGLNPPRVAGRWVPEMISIAGGEDVAGPPGLSSPQVGWGELSGLNPEVVIVMPEGVTAEEARAQAMEHWERLEALGATRLFAVDAAATFSTPGPWLVDGVELLGHLLHPALVDPPGSADFVELRAPVARPGPF